MFWISLMKKKFIIMGGELIVGGFSSEDWLYFVS